MKKLNEKKSILNLNQKTTSSYYDNKKGLSSTEDKYKDKAVNKVNYYQKIL